MKSITITAALAFLSAPLVHAVPRTFTPSSNALPIRDVDLLADLESRHNATLAALSAGDSSVVRVGRGQEGGLAKRSSLGGMIVRAIIKEISERVADRLEEVFNIETDEVWFSEDKCRASFRTQGGGNEGIWSYDVGYDYDNPSGTHKFDAGWIDPENNDPPVHYYHDEGIGHFSVQFTGTGEVAWSGTPGTKKCGFEGLCNPQFVFYRDGYEIILNEWQSQGTKSQCYYSDGEDCGGLCSSGVKNQFASGGMKWAGDCAIPCFVDGQLPDAGSRA